MSEFEPQLTRTTEEKWKDSGLSERCPEIDPYSAIGWTGLDLTEQLEDAMHEHKYASSAEGNEKRFAEAILNLAQEKIGVFYLFYDSLAKLNESTLYQHAVNTTHENITKQLESKKSISPHLRNELVTLTNTLKVQYLDGSGQHFQPSAQAEAA